MTFGLTPMWLYLLLSNLSGEVQEYMKLAESRGNYGGDARRGRHDLRAQIQWYKDVKAYMTKWIAEHRDGRDDLWTKAHGAINEHLEADAPPGGAGGYENRTAATKSGVYQ